MGLDANISIKAKTNNKCLGKLGKVMDALKEDGEKVEAFGKVDVAYWRKNNALHRYMVEHFGDKENDNCVPMYMDIEDIRELRHNLGVLAEKIELINGWVKTDTEIKREVGDTEFEVVGKGKIHLSDLEVGDILQTDKDELLRVVGKNDIYDNSVLILDYTINHYVRGKVVANKEECEKIFPTMEGFFFGSTEYDEWYLEMVKDAMDGLDKVDNAYQTLREFGIEDKDIQLEYSAWY